METKYCECCGASMKEYTHSLSKGLVDALMKFAKFSKGKNNVKLRDVGLNNNQFANFQKLHYHQVIERDTEPNTWKITAKGISFLRCEIQVNQKVVTYRGEFKEYAGGMVYIKDIIKDMESDYWQKEF